MDDTLTDNTLLLQRGPLGRGNELTKTLTLKSHHQMNFNVMSMTLKNFNFCYLILIILINDNQLFALS